MSNCDFVAGRSLIDWVASRLALRAPALRATTLTRPNRSAQRLACDRHSVPLARAGGPNDVVANHCIEHRNHLTHHCHDHDFGEFAVRGQTTMEGLQRRVPIAGAQGGHVQHMANGRASTPDTTPPFELARSRKVRRRPEPRSVCDSIGRAPAAAQSACRPALGQHPAWT